MAGYHVIVETERTLDEQSAGEIARALCDAYPGHPWHINIAGRRLIIKHMKMSQKWAMVRPYDDVHDANRLKHEAVMAAGEFLERANLVRGAARDERLVGVDGIPKKDLVIG